MKTAGWDTHIRNFEETPLSSYTHRYDNLPSTGEVLVLTGDPFLLYLTGHELGFWHCAFHLHCTTTGILLVRFPYTEVLCKSYRIINTGSVARKQKKAITLLMILSFIQESIPSNVQRSRTLRRWSMRGRPQSTQLWWWVVLWLFFINTALLSTTPSSWMAVLSTVLHWLSPPMSKIAFARALKARVME